MRLAVTGPMPLMSPLPRYFSSPVNVAGLVSVHGDTETGDRTSVAHEKCR